MNIAVLGSGNGGCAVAFDCAAHGHQVSLFDFEQFPENIKAIQDNEGIYCEGELEGFQKVAYAGHKIEKALDGADHICRWRGVQDRGPSPKSANLTSSKGRS